MPGTTGRTPLALGLHRYNVAAQERNKTSLNDVIQYVPMAGDCDWHGWLRTLFSVRGRQLTHITPPILAVVAASVARVLLPDLLAAPSTLETPYAMFITPLGLLLVFRVNRAAVRFYDARAAMGKVTEKCRTLVGQAVVYCAHDMLDCDDICRWVVVFPVATRNHLRGEPPSTEELDAILSSNEIHMLRQAAVQPLVCIDQMRLAVMRATRSNRFDSSATAATALLLMEQSICDLSGACGAMERINSTPLPFAYVSHLRTVLLLYLLGIPTVLPRELGWAIPVVSFLVAFALLGIEAAAVATERPFHGVENHLPLGRCCAGVADNTAQILRQYLPKHVPLPETAQ